MHYWIALGSNLEDRLAQLCAAVKALAQAGTVTATSSVYCTAPMYVVDQGAFYNAAVGWRSGVRPQAALAILLEIERQHGRVRSLPNGPRRIDLDLLAAEDDTGTPVLVQDETLLLPHPRMPERDFVLYPMLDIAPDWTHPTVGRTIRQLVLAVGPPPPVVAPGTILLAAAGR